MLDGEDLTSEQDQPEARGFVGLEVSELHERTQGRSRRTPNGQPIRYDKSCEVPWAPSKAFRDEVYSRPVFDGHVQIEDRRVEMKRRMAAESVVLRGFKFR